MNPDIRLLDVEKDKDVLTEAWSWRDDAPKWFRESLDIFKETFDEYMNAVPSELHYGVFDERAIAVIRLIEAEPYVFNIHLSARRGAEFDTLVVAGAALRDYLFENGVKGFFGWLPTINRGVARLYRSLGFTDTGLRIYKGQIHGKTVEFVQYAKTVV